MTIDATKIPAKVTITNVNVAPEAVNEENKFEGYVRIPVYRVTTQEVELAPGDDLQLIATTSAEVLFYLALQESLSGITVKAEEVGE